MVFLGEEAIIATAWLTPDGVTAVALTHDQHKPDSRIECSKQMRLPQSSALADKPPVALVRGCLPHHGDFIVPALLVLPPGSAFLVDRYVSSMRRTTSSVMSMSLR